MFVSREDKTLHCIARMIQDFENGVCVKCLYCKYAHECVREFHEKNKVYFLEVMKNLQKKTGVVLLPPECGEKVEDKELFLKGSWVEGNTELLEKFTNMSYSEQLDILCSPDILKYEDKI